MMLSFFPDMCAICISFSLNYFHILYLIFYWLVFSNRNGILRSQHGNFQTYTKIE